MKKVILALLFGFSALTATFAFADDANQSSDNTQEVGTCIFPFC